MKGIFLSLITSICFLNAVDAQSTATATPQQKVKELVAKMSAACNLKPEQAEKISKAYLDYYTKHDALKKQKDILGLSFVFNSKF